MFLVTQLQKNDGELIRLQSLYRSLDDFEIKFWKLRRDFSESAQLRCRDYLKSRKSYIIKFLNGDNQN